MTTMKLVQLELACPKCGSHDITYSCEPKCCFSHVCGDCYFQFWPVTRFAGRVAEAFEAPPGEKDCLLPTTECARCHSLNVCSVQGEAGAFVCADCASVLSMEYSEEAPD